MAYFNTRLIARNNYGAPRRGLSGFLDDALSKVKAGAGAVLDFYGQEQQAKGANAALQTENAQLAAQLAAKQQADAGGGFLGLSTTEILLAGGGVALAVLLLRRK